MKVFVRIINLFFLSIFLKLEVTAQTNSTNQSIIPPSPAALTFQKYIDYPVDISTGVPQISVPLYTISLKDYSFPIAASFHASGRTTALNFSPLGMNWALIASGVINREVRGRPDENAQGAHLEKSAGDFYPQSQHYDDLLSIDQNATYYNTRKDNMYDIYSLSVNGISAKFIIKDNGTVMFLTYCPFTLVRSSDWNLLTLTDNKGIMYNFGNEGSGYGATEITKSYSMPSPSTWYLSSITTPSGSKISFKYAQPTVWPGTWIGNWIYRDQIIVQDGDTWNSSSASYPSTGSTESSFKSYYNISETIKYSNFKDVTDYNMFYLSEIDFDNGKVQFNYPNTTSTTDFLLNSCSVTTSQGTPIKNINFTYFSYLPGTDLYLSNNNSHTIQYITFQDSKGSNVENYSFDYWPGFKGGDVASFAKGKDWWGYANLNPGSSISNNQIPLEKVHIDHGGYDGVAQSYDANITGNTNCKIPNTTAKLVGMIKAIHYPTGGTTEFTYEPNKVYNFQQTLIEGPGIRVQKIVSDDGYGHRTSKSYEYAYPLVSVIPSADYDYFTEKRRMLFVGQGITPQYFYQGFLGSYKYREYNSDPVSEVEAASHYPVYYQQVTEYDDSTATGKNGKTVYSYTYPEYNSSSTSVSLPTSTGGYSNVSMTNGGTDYFSQQTHSLNEWTVPQLSGKVIQKYDVASGTYKTITSTAINYIKLNSVNVPQVSLYQHLEFPTDNGSNTGSIQKMMMADPYDWEVYTLVDRPLSSAVMKPQSETTTTYDDNGNQLASVTTYSYDNPIHVNPTRIVTTTSDSKTLTQYISYPGDYPSSSTPNSDLPMEKVTVETVGGVSKVISGQINTYNNYVVSQNYRWEFSSPVDIASFKFSNRITGTPPPAGAPTAFAADSKYSPKITFTYDAKNNPVTVAPANNLPISYIWGYNQTYPIAQVRNALSKNVFYTSFEDADGNSTAGDSKTGQLSRTASYSKSLTNLDNGAYVLSYWLKSGSTWTLNTSTVNVTLSSYTISLTGQIDELRFYPAGAFMKTYTYKPLVGMTSQNDEKDMINYFEYDDYNRLKLIRDKDNNIVKKICYNQQGMASSCE